MRNHIGSGVLPDALSHFCEDTGETKVKAKVNAEQRNIALSYMKVKQLKADSGTLGFTEKRCIK